MLFDKGRAKCFATTLATVCCVLFSVGPVAAKQAKQQGLWVGGVRYFSEFQGTALTQSSTPKARLAFGSLDFEGPFSIAFDQNQNMWAVFQILDVSPSPALELTRHDFARLRSRHPVKPKLIDILRSGSLTGQFVFPTSIGFDATGNLWAVDNARSVIKLGADQLNQSGTQTAAVTITPQGSTPSNLRFDQSNNLWVVGYPLPFDPSKTMIWRFTPGDRTASGSANPSLIVNLPDQIPVLGDFAFDNAGDLWIVASGSQGQELEMIAASNLTGSGEISPAAEITITSAAFGTAGAGSCLGGIDFDHSGKLWVSVGTDNADCSANTQIVAFTPTQLSTGGNLTPSLIIQQNSNRTNLFLPGPIRFGPTVP